MSSEMDSAPPKRSVVSSARDRIGLRNTVLLFAGVLAGYSLGIVGEGPIDVPVLGPIPATVLGGIGLALAFVTYRRNSCCNDCADDACGCSGECGDSCSYEP
ncbi:hypothetical protein M0R88_12915 [Halorussus gelatinilyticus]|uniref:Uncharacterized protein n=1 Tax=Halorussus gelatinilyticus TaxID=2937524 RepID=A0A8U0IGQ8_9EURY|nr:hypothetical protein [Halorussus gelatinilyticus]UPV99421.1 hypothetical protein M0R88_12915 [Halorussus gelatinilyticus]